MSGRKVRDAKEARRFLAAAQRSGMARAEWARANGINARSLNAWRVILARKESSSPAASPTARALRVVELVPEMAMPPDSTKYRIACGAFSVEVDHGFDDETLGRLLAVVARC